MDVYALRERPHFQLSLVLSTTELTPGRQFREKGLQKSRFLKAAGLTKSFSSIPVTKCWLKKKEEKLETKSTFSSRHETICEDPSVVTAPMEWNKTAHLDETWCGEKYEITFAVSRPWLEKIRKRVLGKSWHQQLREERLFNANRWMFI